MKIFLPIVLLFSLASCATQKSTEKEIEQKAAQSKVSDYKSLGTTIHDLINNSKTLTDTQKAELNKIMMANKETADALTAESFKYRAVLVKELLAGTADKKRVEIMKKDIRKIEEKKLKNTFDTVEKISAIVSTNPDKSEFADALVDHMDRPAYR